MLIRVFRGVIGGGAHEALGRELRDDLLPRIEAHPDVGYVSLGLPWETSPNEYLLRVPLTIRNVHGSGYCLDVSPST